MEWGPEVVVRAYDSPRGRYVSASKMCASSEVTVFYGPFAPTTSDRETPPTPEAPLRFTSLTSAPTGAPVA